MENLIIAILLILVMFITTFILIGGGHNEESAKATHEPMGIMLPQVRLASGHIDEVPPRARLPNNGRNSI